MVQAEGKEPLPTILQREYTAASAKRTRQLSNIRRTSIAGSTVAVLAMVFAIGASLVSVQANSAANSASTREAIANGQSTLALDNVNRAETQVADANAVLTADVDPSRRTGRDGSRTRECRQHSGG